jgi:hypothetical protein
MTITQTVDIPISHRLIIDVPSEIPAGRTVLTFTPARDDTEYLTALPANRERLYKAVEHIEQGKNIISFEDLEQAVQFAEKQAAAQ